MNAIVTQMIILFILVVVGYTISKKKMMDADFDRKLSVFVINVACPCLILSSVMGDTLPDKHFYNTFTYCRICYLCNPDRRRLSAATLSSHKGNRPRYL